MHLKILDFLDVLPIVPLGVKLGARTMGKVLELPIMKVACEQPKWRPVSQVFGAADSSTFIIIPCTCGD
jgi:hypothetical protein